MDTRSLLSTSSSIPLFGQWKTYPAKSDHSRTWFGTTTMSVLPQLMSPPPFTSNAFVPISVFAQSLSLASQFAFQQQQFGRVEPTSTLRHFIFNHHNQQGVYQKNALGKSIHQQTALGVSAGNEVRALAFLDASSSSPGPSLPTNVPTFAPPKQVDSALKTGQKRKSIISGKESDQKRTKTQSCSSVDDSVSEEESESEKDSTSKSQSLRGEKRLVIVFESLGIKGKHPQTFGKSGAMIPDGVCGTHTVYNERWRFEITHSTEPFCTVEKKVCVCLTWKITNLSTGATTNLSETKDEAILRNSQGQTISNKVFRQALEDRARDLELQLKGETNTKKIAHLESLIRGLRPKRFSEGPLVFGLQHKIVQDNLRAEVAT